MTPPSLRARLLSCLELASRATLPGQRIVAIEGAARLLHSLGIGWDAVIKKPGEDSPALPQSDWRADLVLRRRHPHLLNNWERGFISSVSHQRRLTPKQAAALTRAADKIRRTGVPR